MDWSQIGAGLIGAIGAIVLKGIVDWLREGRRQKHERDMRLLDRKIQASADFMGAAERLWRAESGRLTAADSLDNSRSQGDTVYQQYLAKYNAAVEATKSPWADGHTALSTVRLLMPEATSECDAYFEACKNVDFPDKTRDSRDAARSEAEKSLRAALR
ncbi:hypothetical protein V6U81_05780 [Micromonospora sp. CPCC 205711]|uniref:hypothetical protein n=1 Tax=Micromonospora sp. CPCC 205547 TaxID=3122400 RepID=UPI002FEFAED1